MKILVLGGTGAMGVDLVKILGKRGESVTVTSRSERISEFSNVKYVKGDAHNKEFLKLILNENYDAIVDFMVYSTSEFAARKDMFLDSAKQYVFLSSSRVYAYSEKPISEDSPRLLDVTADEEYLKTDEYALTKARQENLLFGSEKQNWTVIRPYITYSSQRLQLGVYEKELWLDRALNDKTIIFPKAILEKYTTLTFGGDVALGISKLIGNKNAIGEVFHITTDKTIKWDNVLAIYKRVFKDVTDKEIRIEYADDPKPIYLAMKNKYQVIYDRLYDRKFDNSKFIKAAGECSFESPEIGLERCLRDFLHTPKFRQEHLRAQAWMDKETGDHTSIKQFEEIKNKLKYIIGRYTPYFKIELKGK